MGSDNSKEFTEPTTAYWQTIEADVPLARRRPPFKFGYPARLPDSRYLVLPIRRREQPGRAVASFIANHASFEVLDALAEHMTGQVVDKAPDVVIGLPTLGLALAPLIARRLGHQTFVPLGTSRKFWYDEKLSQPLKSLTTTQAGRNLYVDPNLVPRLNGRRAIIVDDTISTGATAVSAIELALRAGAEVVGLSFAMSQGETWREALTALGSQWPRLVSFVFQSPHFTLAEGGWEPVSETQRAGPLSPQSGERYGEGPGE
jgi:adenine/guanine phosphoribosyltransferase-like PRPP-binding protein